jgi:hypothetical protein
MKVNFFTRIAKVLVVGAALTALAAPAALARPDGYAVNWYGYAATHVQAGGPDTWYAYATSQGPKQGDKGITVITDTLSPGSGTLSDPCMHVVPVTLVQAKACAAPQEPTSVPVQPVGDGTGFDWGIFGIAAGSALALLLGLLGGLRVRSHRQPATV